MKQKIRPKYIKALGSAKSLHLITMLIVVGGVTGSLYFRSLHLTSSAQNPYSVTGYRVFGSADTPFPDGVGTTVLDGLSVSANPFSFGTSGGDKTISSSGSINYNGVAYTFSYGRLCYNNNIPSCPGGPIISYSQPIYISNPSSYADVWFSYAPTPPSVVVQANGSQSSIVIIQNSALTIAWGSNNATSCNASGSWSGAKSVQGGSENHNADTATTGQKNYALNCQGPGGSASYSVTVTVQAPAPPPPPPPPPGPTPTPTPTPTPSPTPTPPPAPTPSPNPTPTPSPSPSPQTQTPPPTLQGGGVIRPTVVAPANVPDTTPPSTPAEMFARPNEQGVSVHLGWSASSDNVAVQSYQLERSDDQISWRIISAGRGDTTYNDQEVSFQTHYFYRVRATDAAGNNSGYASVETTTAGFSGNVLPDRETTLTNAEEKLQITIPAGAVTEPASCSIETLALESPKVKGYRVVSGPIQVFCKKADNTTIIGFDKPLTVQWTILPSKNISGALEYYEHDDNWQKLTVASHDSASHTDIFSFDKGVTIIAMGKIKKTPPVVKIVLVVTIIAGIVVSVGSVVYRRERRKKTSHTR